MAPSNRYAPPAPFTTPQCPPVYDDDNLPEPAIQPDGTQVTCDCDDGLMGNTCGGCDGGVLSDFLWEELAAAVAGSDDVKSCSGNVTVRTHRVLPASLWLPPGAVGSACLLLLNHLCAC